MTLDLSSISENEEILLPPIKAPGISRKKRRHRSIMSSHDQTMKTASSDEKDEKDISSAAWEAAMAEIQRLKEVIKKQNEEIERLQERVITLISVVRRAEIKK